MDCKSFALRCVSLTGTRAVSEPLLPRSGQTGRASAASSAAACRATNPAAGKMYTIGIKQEEEACSFRFQLLLATFDSSYYLQLSIPAAACNYDVQLLPATAHQLVPAAE
jgi:hypothetical protein